MKVITKESAKQHCGTCLKKVFDETLEEQIKYYALEENVNKSISINVSTDANLRHLIEKYIEDIATDIAEFPQNVCFTCFNKLQEFDKFRKQALENVATLKLLFVEGGVTKVELNDDDENRKAIDNEINSNMMFKDALMETETVVLNDHSVNVEVPSADPFSAQKIKNETIQKNCKTRKKPLATPATHNDKDHVSGSDKSCASDNEDLSYIPSSSCDDDEDDDDCAPLSKLLCQNNDDIVSRKEVDDYTPLSKLYKSNTDAASRKLRSFRRQRKKDIELTKKSKRRAKKSPRHQYRCNQCNHSFAYKLTRDAHIRKVHEGNKHPYQCDRCDKVYTSFLALSIHISVVHEAEVHSYTCEYTDCSKTYTSLNALQRHKRVKHLGLVSKKTFVCELCGASFSNLRYHLIRRHPMEAGELSKEKHICNICNKNFFSNYTLKYHMLQVHSNDMKFECNVCGKRLAKKFMLVQHMRVHSLDCLPCNLCDKQFKLKNKLQSHIRAVHLKLKPYSCQYCPESFAKCSTLRHHEYIHTGEKPYVCDICGQAYRQNNTLKTHKKSHEKMMPGILLAKSINRTLETFLGGQPPKEQ